MDVKLLLTTSSPAQQCSSPAQMSKAYTKQKSHNSTEHVYLQGRLKPFRGLKQNFRSRLFRNKFIFLTFYEKNLVTLLNSKVFFS